MARIKFQRTVEPVCSIEFSRNPSIRDGNNEEIIGYLQPKERAGGGDWYVDDLADNPENYRVLDFSSNPETDWINFKTFLATVRAATYNFLFHDSTGLIIYTARIWNADNIKKRMVSTGRVAFSIELLIEAEEKIEILTTEDGKELKTESGDKIRLE